MSFSFAQGGYNTVNVKNEIIMMGCVLVIGGIASLFINFIGLLIFCIVAVFIVHGYFVAKS